MRQLSECAMPAQPSHVPRDIQRTIVFLDVADVSFRVSPTITLSFRPIWLKRRS